MKLSKSGATLAVAAAALVMGGTFVAPVAHAADDAKVHCTGVNACKGTGACKGASNACKGKNACKGQGFMEMTAKDCTDKGGKVVKG